MASTKLLNYTLTLSCLAGLGLSIYAYIVELASEQSSNYAPMCDINEYVSCTKPFKSRYGKGFGLFSEDSFFYKPNSLVGILFYSLMGTLAQSNSMLITKLGFLLILLSNFASVYFAYILYFKLYTLCIVCVSTYVVNFVNLLLISAKWSAIEKSEESGKKKKKH